MLTAPHLSSTAFLFRLLVMALVGSMLIYLTRIVLFDIWEKKSNRLSKRVPSAKRRCPNPLPCPICKCFGEADIMDVVRLGKYHEGTSFGRALYKLAKQDDVNLALEIGTSFGGGSTKSISLAFQEKKKGELYTIEVQVSFTLH